MEIFFGGLFVFGSGQDIRPRYHYLFRPFRRRGHLKYKTSPLCLLFIHVTVYHYYCS